jgi:large subunit ribosomal protein L15
MKLHDLRPAPGSHKARRRVGRGIAAGQGKTAGRGTKGQKARAGGSIPAWFEGGQTPLHQRIPKLHGFRNPFRIEYEVVNIGAIAHLVELATLESGEMPGGSARKSKSTPAPVTVNQEILRAAGLVRTLNKPLKILGAGELSTALFVVADAFSGSARSKIEAAGGSVSVLEVPKERKAAIGVAPETAPKTETETEAETAPRTETETETGIAAEAPTETETEPKTRAQTEPLQAEAAQPEIETASEAAPARRARAAKSAPPEAAHPKEPKATASKVTAAADAADAASAAPKSAAKAPKPRASRKPKAAAPDTEA